MLRRALLTVLLLTVPVSASAKTTREADLAHREARAAHVALKKDTARRKFRHHWLNVADKYELVARGHPRTDRAPEALFAAAQMLEELSRISRNPEDLLRAASDYRKVVEIAPRHPLADDSALEVARIQLDLLGRPEDARRTAERALKQLPPGDRTRELKALLAALPAEKRRKSGNDGKDTSREPRQALLAAMARMGTQESARSSETNTDTASGKAPTGNRRAEESNKGQAAREGSAPVRAERTGGAGSSGPGVDRARPEADPAVRAERTDVRGSTDVANPREGAAPRDGAVPTLHADRAGARESAASRDDIHHAGAAESRRGDGRMTDLGVAGEDVGRISASGAPAEARDGSASESSGDRWAVRADAEGPGVTLPGVPRDLPVIRAAPRSSEPEQAPEKRLGAREARARIKAMGGVKDAEVTLAEQLGLKVRRVIIDPGHGGHDSGALGPSGKKEKDVSLAISRKLASRLRAEGLEVLLTRERDSFVRLEDRAQFANDHRGDLFISVHCNSATSRKLRGVETYSLNIASDRYSIRLAARENASSEKSISDLQFILADLATKANTEESTHLATRVQKALVESLAAKDAGLRDLGHKQALFYVLLGAKMPAILVETSFISNPEDERRLASAKYQDQVAAAIADGVRSFLDNRDRVAQVE